MLESPDLPRPDEAGLLDAPARPALIRPSIQAVAVSLPAQRLRTSELALRFGVSEDWIVSRTGVRERPIARPDERLSDHCARAGLAALERAGVPAEELDLVIVATMTADEVTPNAAPLVAHAMGARNAGAFDIGAACTAFLSGVSIAASQIETGRSRWAVVAGADFISRVLDWEDRRTAPLFADAAGAVVIGPAGDVGGIGPIVLGSDGSAADAIVVECADRKLRMDGPEVYRNAVARMTDSTLLAVERAGLTLEDIDLFVYHQANARITRALGERLGLPGERVVDCIENLGNSSAGTLPIALAEAEADGRLKPGATVLLGAFGAGFTWGGGVIEWGGPRDA